MTTLTASHFLALSIFASYFLLIFFLLYVVLSSIRKHAHTQLVTQGKSHRGLVFGGLAIASFAHTWYWMFRFMAWSFHDFEATHTRPDALQQLDLLRFASWLNDTALFEQAWSTVCTGPLNWWWSEQLCLFTAGAFTVFLFLHRDRVPHVWAYMLLGQAVAISVAWSLLNVALVLTPPRPRSSRSAVLPPFVTVPILLSLFAVSLSPYTTPDTFLPNLLAMHALLILPLLPLPDILPPRLSPRSTSFYTLIALLSLLLRTRTTLSVLASLRITSSPFFSVRYPADVAVGLWNAPWAIYAGAWETLNSHPAQASIGWDIVWTSVVWLAWGICGERGTEGMRWTPTGTVMQSLQVAVASVGVVAPLQFGHALREEDRDARDDVKTE